MLGKRAEGWIGQCTGCEDTGTMLCSMRSNGCRDSMRSNNERCLNRHRTSKPSLYPVESVLRSPRTIHPLMGIAQFAGSWEIRTSPDYRYQARPFGKLSPTPDHERRSSSKIFHVRQVAENKPTASSRGPHGKLYPELPAKKTFALKVAW